MKIVLSTIHINPLFTPLALLYLKAYLVEVDGLELSSIPILEFKLEDTEEEILKAILAQNPELVGFSCYIWNIKKTLSLCRLLRSARPHTKIVLGGPEVGPVAREVLTQHPYVDIVVKSEGEVPFSDIVKCFSNSGALEQVKGIAFRDGLDVHETASASILSDLNRLPSPHHLKYGNFSNRVICLETQRGCVFRCNFCFYNKDLSIRNRRFDMQRVKNELVYWLQQDVAEIYLMDPVFNLNARRAKEICEFVAEHNSRKIKFHTEIWAEFVDAEMAELFAKANFEILEVGLQTTETTVLAGVERRFNLDPFIQGIRHLLSRGLKFELHLIFGLPGETRESFRESLDFAMALQPTRISVFMLMILPGTELWRSAARLKIEYKTEPYYHILRTTSMSSEDIDYGWRVCSAASNLSGSNLIKIILKETGLPFSKLVDEWIAEQPPGTCMNEEDKILVASTVHRFINDFLARRNLSCEFYTRFLDLEFPLNGLRSKSIAPCLKNSPVASLQPAVSVAKNLVSRTVNEQEILLNFESGDSYFLDPIGTKIFGLIKRGCSPRQIVHEITAEYEVEGDRAERDVNNFLQNLERHALIELC